MSHKEIRDIDDVLKIPIRRSIAHRLPWLVIGLIGGVFAAKIVEGFEAILSQNLVLAAYIPLIVYMSDAMGTQMEAFAIRDFAIHSHLHFVKYFLRQTIVVTIMGAVLSLGLFAFSMIVNGSTQMAVVLGVSLYAAIITSLFTGLIVPYLFRFVKLDPANASGPIATIIQDIVSVAVYFTVASFLL